MSMENGLVMAHHSLFPTLVGTFDLGRKLTEAEKSFFLGLPQRANKGNSRSQDHYILRHEELREINEFIVAATNAYFNIHYAPKNGVELKITQSWCNYTEPGQYHHAHTHPNSLVSGVFYVQTTEQDRIYFYRDVYQQVKVQTERWNLWNSQSWWFNATECQLILFPSSLTHTVDTVKGESTRVSLSYNTFPVGYVGEEDDLTALYL